MAVMDDPADQAATFQELSKLEEQFVNAELEALRQKEFLLKPLYVKRQTLVGRIHEFWPTVFHNSPEDVEECFAPSDLAVLACLKSFSVDRYQINSSSQGEPRSLRFTFEFGKNEYFEDTKLVKDLEYNSTPHSGGYVSKPVPIKWKSSKHDLTNGLLNAAVELHGAEQTMQFKNGDTIIDGVEQESLWQYEKLREKLEKAGQSDEQLSFFNWFGYRGAGLKKQMDEDNEMDDEDNEEEQLEVEIYPPGEDLAIALADDLWPDALDCFMAAQIGGGIDSDEDDVEGVGDLDEDAPDLVPAENGRPSKKPRTS